MNDLFISETSPSTNLAGVFEYDGSVGYFYLFRIADDATSKILDAIRVVNGTPDFDENEVSIRWSSDGARVALFIREIPWALFDSSQRKKFGADYVTGGASPIAAEHFSDF